jgi:hypothetical protein
MTHYGQVKAIHTADLYEPRVTNAATVAAVVKAGLVKKAGAR